MQKIFARWAPAPRDLIAGLTLAAVAIPEHMATARLGGLPPQAGFVALIAGALGFALFGANRRLSVGADSTIAPIFAGALAAFAATGSEHFQAMAALLAALVGVFVALGGMFRLGFIADLLSIPVLTGFLAGVAGHIAVSQAPALLGVEVARAPMLEQMVALAKGLPQTNGFALALGLFAFVTAVGCERVSARLPGALIGVAGATIAVIVFGLEARGVTTLGETPPMTLHFGWEALTKEDVAHVLGLAIVVGMVVMVQTAATVRAFAEAPATSADINRDFRGVGAANILAGLVGAFPVNASPPRTAVVCEAGGASQAGALFAAALTAMLSLFGASLLRFVPHAALAGVLLYVAARIFRASVMRDIWRRSRPEFALMLATVMAIVVLPIQHGVGLGVLLSLMHGLWATTRAEPVEFARIPGTSVWWPRAGQFVGETVPGVRVIGLQAPLSFLNAYAFQAQLESVGAQVRLVVIEAGSLVEVDYTAAKTLADAIVALRAKGVNVAVARLESLQAQQAFREKKLADLLGPGRLFITVEEAVRALAPHSLSVD